MVTDTNDQLVSCNDKHTHPPKATETAVEMVKAATEVSIMPLAAGGLSTRRRRKYRLHEKRLETIKEKYKAGDYTLSKFLKAHSHWMSF